MIFEQTEQQLTKAEITAFEQQYEIELPETFKHTTEAIRHTNTSKGQTIYLQLTASTLLNMDASPLKS